MIGPVIGKTMAPMTKALLATGLVVGILLAVSACAGGGEPTVTPTTGVPTNVAELAQGIQQGEIDVGAEYGLRFGQRYHTIHATTLGLDCFTCHIANPDTVQTLFGARDVSPQAPGPVERRACLECHRTGPAHNLYGPADF